MKKEAFRFTYRGYEIKMQWPVTVYIKEEFGKRTRFQALIGCIFGFPEKHKAHCQGINVDFHSYLHGPDCKEQKLNSFEEIVHEYLEQWKKKVDEEIDKKYQYSKEIAVKFGCDEPKLPTNDCALTVAPCCPWIDIHNLF